MRSNLSSRAKTSGEVISSPLQHTAVLFWLESAAKETRIMVISFQDLS